ncbi:hypothetical protein GCM10020001_116770 [Nonomuraea salmonea]
MLRWVSSTAGAASASMNATRSGGYSGSIGRYAAPRLEHAEQAGQQLQRAFRAHGDHRPGARAEVAQRPGDPVRRRVQLAVGQ